MNKIYLFILLFAFSIQVGFSQTVPQGMNYQAVARDKAGKVVANENIQLQIVLFSNSQGKTKHYIELHSIQTNKLGLFSLVIGEGESQTGEFKSIPWESEEIWMDVFVKRRNQASFSIITSTKLQSVPYAFVAGSIAQQDSANSRFKITNCPCHVGLVELEVLYLGENGAVVNAYSDQNLSKLINTFSIVNNGDILLLNASGVAPSGTFTDVTYMELTTGSGTTVTKMNTKCADYDQDLNSPVAGETFGNFSILTHTDKSNQTCRACDMKPDWKVGGNAVFNDCNAIGTLTNADLVFITNNIERMRILSSGDVDIANSLAVGVDLHVGNNAEICNDLTVKQSVNLNTLGGATTNYGPFTVGNIKPTHLTGTLRVDKLTDLNDGLNVNNQSFTHLTGKLQVDNETDLFSALTVHNASPTKLTGILDVDSIATFRNRVRLPDSTFNTFHYTQGALVVAGGVGIGLNLHVGGDAKISGTTELNGPLFLTDTHNPTLKTDTFALNVLDGGVLFGRNLLVCGKVDIEQTLDVTGITSLADKLFVTGDAQLSSKLDVTGMTSLSSSLDVGGVTTLNNKLNANGQVTITAPASLVGNDQVYSTYPLQVQGSSQGIAIRVNGVHGGKRGNENNFVSFWDQTAPDGGLVGRIEGEIPTEFGENADYNFDQEMLDYDIYDAEVDYGFALAAEIIAGAQLIKAAVDFRPCVGFGACATAPGPADIAFCVVELASTVAQAIFAALKIGRAHDNQTLYDNNKITYQGVTYASGAGDYAEYLLRSDIDENMSFGDIVGVKGGEISKTTNDADRMMVVSFKPIVLGNMPQPNRENEYEKVAFMGQVRVKVFGIVNIGDYIIPSGKNDGIGIAISPSKITSENVKKIVGIAWSSVDQAFGFNMVNVAVGINNNDNNPIVENLEIQVQQQAIEISELRNQIAKTLTIVSRLEQGFAGTSTNLTSKDDAEKIAKTGIVNGRKYEIIDTKEGEVMAWEVTKEDFEYGLQMLEDVLASDGVDIENNIFLKKIKEDSNFKNELYKNVETKMHKEFLNHRKEYHSDE